MNIMICENYEEVSLKAFEVMKEVLTASAQPVLGLATGSTPIGLYKNLIADHQLSGFSYKNVVTFNLDEYVGLPKSHAESYDTFMHVNLFNHIDIQEANIYLPVGESTDLQKECHTYEELMKEYVLDVQLLGVGRNGHIGFNEPGTSFDKLTHIVKLDQKTIDDNARFFDNDASKVPTQAITMGIATIMKTKKILLLASGEGKADAIYELVKGAQSVNCPVTRLQSHSDVVVIVDKAAAARIL